MLSLEEIFPRVLDDAEATPDLNFIHSGKRVVIFSTTPHWIGYLSLIAIALVKRGCKVDFVWSPVFEHDNRNREEHLNRLATAVYPTLEAFSHPNLRYINLETLPLKVWDAAMQAHLEEQTYRDTVHFSREIKLDLEGRHREVYRRRLHINQVALGAFQTLFDENDYDTALVPNGLVFEWGMFDRVARSLGIPVCTIESFFGWADDMIRIRWDASALLRDMPAVQADWDADEPHVLTPEVAARVAQIQARFNAPKDEHSHQFVSADGAAAAREKLGIPADKPACLIIPSLGHEKHFRLEHFVFDDHIEWLYETLAYLESRPEVTVVLRSHPYPYDGLKDPVGHGKSAERTDAILERRYHGTFPDHFKIIPATAPVNTYDLLELCDFGVTHHSTAGLEMALLGKMVLACTSIHYQGKGFTLDPRDKRSYFDDLDMLLTDPASRTLSARQVELAKCYMDVFFSRWGRMFPWSVLRAFYRYNRYDIRSFLSFAGSLSRYMQTLDGLVDQAPVDGARKLREAEAYCRAARSVDEQEARLLAGQLESIDWSWVEKVYPDQIGEFRRLKAELENLVSGSQRAAVG